MSTAVQHRRGTTAQHATFTGLPGEFTYDTDKKTVVAHDGATAGGLPMARADGGVPWGGDQDANGHGLKNLATLNGGPMGGFRNKIINGNFDIWQRGASQTANGYNSADRWRFDFTGSTQAVSQQTFPLGQTDVPGNPQFFVRNVVTSVAGANNYVAIGQRVEGVTTLAGKKVTYTFWAKADAPKIVSVFIEQNFGTSGSPSASVVTQVGHVTLSTAWQRCTFTLTLPSIAGKTRGTNGDDYLNAAILLDAGATIAASFGPSQVQQSGTFDIAHVSLVEGDATQEVDQFSPRSFGEEVVLCQRYFEVTYARLRASDATSGVSVGVNFKATKRTIPTLSAVTSPVSTGNATINGYSLIVTGAGLQDSGVLAVTASAEL